MNSTDKSPELLADEWLQEFIKLKQDLLQLEKDYKRTKNELIHQSASALSHHEKYLRLSKRVMRELE